MFEDAIVEEIEERISHVQITKEDYSKQFISHDEPTYVKQKKKSNYNLSNEKNLKEFDSDEIDHDF